jgi:Family of unknown function (DUF6510)
MHTDGNHVAGLLAQVFAVDTTTVMRRCHSCGSDRPMAEHRAYHGAGVVLRCPACDDVAVRIAVRDDGLTAELRGAFVVALPAVE